MSLDFYLSRVQEVDVFDGNITHNLSGMAREAGIYEILWRPEECGIQTAAQLVEPLEKAVAEMEADPPRFKKYNSPNGWGLYEHFVPFVKEVLLACQEFPDARVRASR